MQRQGPDRKRCDGGRSASDVVAQTHGRRTYFAWEYFTRDGGVAGEKSCSEKSHEWAKQQQPERALGRTIDRRQPGGNQQINKVRFTTPERIGEESERRVTQPFSETQDQKKCCRLSQTQAASSLRNWQRQVSRDPCEQSPVAKHPEGVHRGGQKPHAKNSFAKQQPKESGLIYWRAIFPHRGLGHIAAEQ